MPNLANLETIGWKESIDLPDWGIANLVAKTDTGARRSAIDVKDIVELPGKRVQFEVVLRRKGGYLSQIVVAKIAKQAHVRSSNGLGHERYFVQAKARIGHSIQTIELSLTCRAHMNCRMLLGRAALEGRYTVDPQQAYLTRPRRKPKLISIKPA